MSKSMRAISTTFLAIIMAFATIVIPHQTFSAASGNALYLSQSSFRVIEGEVWSTKVNVSNKSGSKLENIDFQFVDNSDGIVSVYPPDGGYSNMLNNGIYFRISPPPASANSLLSYDLIASYSQYTDGILKDYEQILNINIVIESAAAAATPNPDPTPIPAPNVPSVVQAAPLYYVNFKPLETKKLTVSVKNDSKAVAAGFKFSPVVDKNFTLVNPSVNSRFDIKIGETKSIVIDVTPDKGIVGKHEIELPFTYSDRDGTPYTGSAMLYINIPEDPKPTETPPPTSPYLILEDFTISPEIIKNGDNFTIKGFVSNIAGTAADGVQIAVTSGLSPETIGIPNASNSVLLGTIAAKNKAAFEYVFSASKNIIAGNYPITFSVSGIDIESRDFTYYVSVSGTASSLDDPDLAVVETESVSDLVESYDVGSVFEIVVAVKNTGKTDAKNIRVEAKPPLGIVPKSASIKVVETLAPGEIKQVSFSFSPTIDALSQNYSIEFDFSYQAGVTNTVPSEKIMEAFVQYGSVNIANTKAEPTIEPSEANKSIPKIIVSDYTITSESEDDPTTVLAGQEFDLFLEFQNTHRTKPVYNIKITLSTPASATGEKGNVFSPVGSSNTLYINEIAPGGTYEKTMRMFCILSAAVKNHIIAIDFEYEDENGNTLIQHEEVGVNVTQEAKLEIGNIWLLNVVNQNEPNWINFYLQNTGRIPIYNLKVWLENGGDSESNPFDLSGTELIIGNLLSGDSRSYDSQFMALEVGVHFLKVIIQYDLETGKRVVEEYEYDVEIVQNNFGNDMWGGGADEMIPDFGMEDFPDEGFDESAEKVDWNGSIIFWVSLGVAIVIVAGIIVTIVIVRNKRKGFDLDE